MTVPNPVRPGSRCTWRELGVVEEVGVWSELLPMSSGLLRRKWVGRDMTCGVMLVGGVIALFPKPGYWTVLG